MVVFKNGKGYSFPDITDNYDLTTATTILIAIREDGTREVFEVDGRLHAAMSQVIAIHNLETPSPLAGIRIIQFSPVDFPVYQDQNTNCERYYSPNLKVPVRFSQKG